MRKSRVIKIIFTLFLTVSILLCSSVFVSAYFPIVNIESDEWDISTEMTYSAVYPDRINEFAYTGIVDDCFSYSDLNGQTYYGSCFWRDDYPYLTESDIIFPAFPIGSSYALGENLKGFNKLVFKSGDSFYCAFVLAANKAYMDSDMSTKYLHFDLTGRTGEINYYRLSYPYSTWVFDSYVDYYGDSHVATFSVGMDSGFASVDILWSDFNVYYYDKSTVYHSADSYDLVGTSYTLEYTKPLSVLTGALSFELSASELKFLSAGACCVRIDDFGLIAGTSTSFYYYNYFFNVYDSSGSCYSSDRFIYDPNSSVSLSPGDKFIDDIIIFADFSLDLYDLPTYTVELCFVFVSDGYNLFFPGTFEIIEFESYEDDMEHKEVVSCINEASSVVAGEISSARSELSSEIADAASNISTSINTNFNELMHGDTGYPEPSFDTSDIDNVVSEQDQVLEDVLATLNSNITSYLPEGYLSFDQYFENTADILITKYSNAFLAVRNVFDRFVAETDITILILFSLIFGFCIFVLGRRLDRS